MIETNEAALALKRKLMNPQKVCRLCLAERKTHNIFLRCYDPQQGRTSQSVAEILATYFRLQVVESHNQPNGICGYCLHEVTYVKNIIERGVKNNIVIDEHCGPALDLSEYVRPGLDGAPGEFILRKGERVIDIKPVVECETTDESSISDSEMNDVPDETQDETSNLNSGISNSIVNPIPQPTETIQLATTNNGVKSIDNSFLCQFCDKAFTNHADMISHEALHDKIYAFLCNICQFKTTTRQLLIAHIRSSHDKTRPYICTICNKGFCRRSDLKKHGSVHTGIRPYICHVCKKSFSRNTNLTKHMRIHNSLKPHVCQQCPRSFPSSVELIRHSRSHSEIKPFKCMHCPSSFTRKDKLNLHLNTHKPKMYNPEIVPAVVQPPFPSPSNLSLQFGNVFSADNSFFETSNPVTTPVEVPMPSPTSVPDPYRHSILAAQLQQRPLPIPKMQMLQKQSRQFRCKICDKSFTRERDLQQHQALHLDTLFNCNICKMSFNRREKLERHEVEFHAPRYPCGVCGQIFLKQQDVTEHLNLHSMESSLQPPQQQPMMNLGFYSEARLDDGNQFL